MVTIALSVVCPMKWVEGGGVTASREEATGDVRMYSEPRHSYAMVISA